MPIWATVAIVLVVGIVAIVAALVFCLSTKCPQCRKRSFGKVSLPISRDFAGEYSQLIETCKFCGMIMWRGTRNYFDDKSK